MFDEIKQKGNFIGKQEDVLQPIETNFKWDQDIYAKSRKAATAAAIASPFVAFGGLYVATYSFRSVLNPLAWPHLSLHAFMPTAYQNFPGSSIISFFGAWILILFLLKKFGKRCFGTKR